MSAWLSIAITVILVVVAFLILNRNITVRTSQQAALEEIKREVGAILTELNATTERNIELMEDRISTLEQLIEKADRRVGALRRDLETHGATERFAGERYDRSGRLERSAPTGRTPRTDTGNRGAVADSSADGEEEPTGGRGTPADAGAGARTADRGEASEGRAPANESDGDAFFVSRSGSVRQESSSGRPDPQLPLRERVRGLYLQGLSLERIASIVGKTVGEVELIVSLDEGMKR